MVKVTSSLTLVPYESVLLVEYACQVWSILISYGLKVMAKVKVFVEDRHTDRLDKTRSPRIPLQGHKCKIQKNWCTVIVAPTIEHTDPCKPEARPGDRKESESPAWLAAPAMNARNTTKVYIWRLDT